MESQCKGKLNLYSQSWDSKIDFIVSYFSNSCKTKINWLLICVYTWFQEVRIHSFMCHRWVKVILWRSFCNVSSCTQKIKCVTLIQRQPTGTINLEDLQKRLQAGNLFIMYKSCSGLALGKFIQSRAAWRRRYVYVYL